MLVKLTNRELSDARKAASGRWKLSRAAGVVNQKRAAESDEDLDLLGIKAEIAVAKLLRLDYSPFDLGIDDGMDMWFGDKSIDVKATFHETGKLLFKSLEAFRADCGILVTKTQDDSVMNVAGGCSRQRFLQEAEHVDLGRGKCYVMQQENLQPIQQVWYALAEAEYG